MYQHQSYQSLVNHMPQLQAEQTLLQHIYDTLPPTPTLVSHICYRIDQHNFGVKFTYSDGSTKTFDGRNWS